MEDAGRFNGQRTVDIDREIAVPFDQAPVFDLPDKIQHLLGAAHRKAGDDHIAATVQGALQNSAQLPYIVRPGAVAAVAVGGLHHHIICLVQIGGSFRIG